MNVMNIVRVLSVNSELILKVEEFSNRLLKGCRVRYVHNERTFGKLVCFIEIPELRE